MTDQSSVPEFSGHERLLLGVLSSLAKRGYFVPPDDARDVLHDFYIDVWRGLTERFDPAVASFRTYVANSFYRYARRRFTEMDRKRQRLAELYYFGQPEWPTMTPTPAEAAEYTQQQEILEETLQQLPDRELQILKEYLKDENASERRIAEKLSLSRYAVRDTLASAIGRVAILSKGIAPNSTDAEIALQLWREGRSAKQTAEHLQLPTAHVQASKLRFARQLLASVRSSDALVTIEGNPMPSESIARLKALLFAESDQFAVLARQADELRHLFEEADDLELTPAELERLREQPDLLVRFYQLLAASPTAEQDEQSEIDHLLEHARQEEGREIGEAFDLMTRDLPSDLLAWDRWFERAKLDAEYIRYLEAQPSVVHGGERARQLLEFGMTPDTFAGAMRGLQLLFDRMLHQTNEAEHLDNRRDIVLISASGQHYYASKIEVSAQVSTAPWLPRGENAAYSLTRWILRLLRVRPCFVRGYEYELRDNTVAFHERPGARVDLIPLWTRTAASIGRERSQMAVEKVAPCG